MRFAHVIEVVYSSPWLITAEAHRSVRALLDHKLGRHVIEHRQEDINSSAMAERVGMFGPIESMEIVGKTAVIPIKGILARGVSQIEKSCGVTDYKDIAKDLAEARDDANVESVFLCMDSPGGTGNGCHECYEEIVRTVAVKPVFAFTEGQMCSACYYLASGCDEIIATPSSMIGSIGVILQVLDESKAYEGAGYKMHTIRSGALKAIGMPGDTISQDQLNHLQELVDRLAIKFKTVVSQHRGLTDEESMQGQVFEADEALDRGLIDRIVNNQAEAMALLT